MTLKCKEFRTGKAEIGKSNLTNFKIILADIHLMLGLMGSVDTCKFSEKFWKTKISGDMSIIQQNSGFMGSVSETKIREFLQFSEIFRGVRTSQEDFN